MAQYDELGEEIPSSHEEKLEASEPSSQDTSPARLENVRTTNTIGQEVDQEKRSQIEHNGMVR